VAWGWGRDGMGRIGSKQEFTEVDKFRSSSCHTYLSVCNEILIPTDDARLFVHELSLVGLCTVL